MNPKTVKIYFSVTGVLLIIVGGIMELTNYSTSGSISNHWTANQHTATMTGYSVIFFGAVFLLIRLMLENMKQD